MNELGQLIITGLSGLTLTKEEKEFLKEGDIGGVILFTRNYESPGQLAELVNNIQAQRGDYPLFITVDHEGGRVIRFKTHFTQFPSMKTVSELGSPKFCFNMAKIMAQELLSCGVNLNYSPCCDILNNPKNKVIGDRAFGTDGETVSKFVSSVVRGLQTHDVLACAKHFPGHGSTLKDSHFDLPIIKTSLEDLRENEFQPFVKAIKSRVETIMMGHLMVDSIDDQKPCSLSKKAHQILREELKFTKLILSDDMQMQAITDHYGLEEAAFLALDAGTDILIYRDMDYAKKAFESLKLQLKEGKLDPEDIKTKVERVKTCKKSFLKEYSPLYIPEVGKKINTQDSKHFMADLEKKMSECSP